jgi:hypothetical protein
MPPKFTAIRRPPGFPLVLLCFSSLWILHLSTCHACRIYYIAAHAPYLLDSINDYDPDLDL